MPGILNDPFCSKHYSRDYQCFWMGRKTSKIAHSHGDLESWPSCNNWLLGPSSPSNSILIRSFDFVYTTARLPVLINGPDNPKNCPSPLRDLHSMQYMVPLAQQSQLFKQHLDWFSSFARLTKVTNTQTDRPDKVVCSDRLHRPPLLAIAAMWSNNILFHVRQVISCFTLPATLLSSDKVPLVCRKPVYKVSVMIMIRFTNELNVCIHEASHT